MAIAAIVVAAAAFFVIAGGIESRPASGPKTLEARVIRLTPDPTVVMVGVAWSGDGWCVGELRVTAKETDSEVFVGAVTDDLIGGLCAGVGALWDTAYADLTLRAPLGSRRVIRSRDGKTLPVVAENDHFIPKDPAAAGIYQYGGLNDTPALSLKKQVHITNTSQLQSLARQLDSLPPFPLGTISCPFDDGSYYLVDFTYGDNSVDYPVKVAARGCQGVYVLGVKKPAAWAGGTSPNIVDKLAGLLQA